MCAPRVQSAVEQALHHRVRHDADEVGDRVAEVLERLHQRAALLGLAGVHGDDRDDRLAVHRLGKERRGRSGREVDQRGHLVRQLARPVAVEPQDLFGAVARKEDRAGQQHRSDGMQPVLQRGRDPEVPAAATQAPEQLGVLVLARVHELAVGGDDVGGEQVVAGQADLAHEPADAAAEREPGDPRAGHEPAGHRETERLGLVIEVRPGAAALGDGRAARRVDAHRGHARQVDDDAAVAGRVSGKRMPTAADGHDEVLAAREVDRPHDVGDAGALDDQRRPLVVRAVPDRPRLVVALVLGPDELSAQALLELAERRLAEHVRDGRFRRHVFELLRRDVRTRSTLPGGT